MSWRFIRTARLGVGRDPVGTQPAIPAPTGGDVVDTEARAALAELLVAAESFGLVEAPPPAAAGPGPAQEAPGTPRPRHRRAVG